MKSFSAPFINLNGSSPQTMVVDILAALDALRVATDAVAKTAPHPRDWQTVADSQKLFCQAQNDHFRRMESLTDIREELEAIGIAIQDQADQRRRP